MVGPLRHSGVVVDTADGRRMLIHKVWMKGKQIRGAEFICKTAVILMMMMIAMMMMMMMMMIILILMIKIIILPK